MTPRQRHLNAFRRIAFRPVAFLLVLLAGLAATPAAALETAAREAILLDMETGTVLLEKNADKLTAPSSMTKIMTVYLVFERLKDGRLSLDDTFRVSEKAWRKGGSKMFVEVDSHVRVEDLIRGIVVQSGNDACIVVAEGIAGTEEAFAEMMTEKARELGMNNTTFRNSSGWPDPEHLTSARDLAILAMRTIRDFPDYYPYYSEKVFTYNGIRQANRNPLLFSSVQGDGVKTGHTEVAGYGLVGSVERDGRRLVLVVNGLDSARDRASESERLLSWGLREFDNYALFQAGETVTEGDVWLGATPTVPLVIEDGLTVTLPRQARADMRVSVRYDSPIPAPVRAGARVAVLSIDAPGIDPVEVPLVAGTDVQRLGLFGRLGAALRYIVWGSS